MFGNMFGDNIPIINVPNILQFLWAAAAWDPSYGARWNWRVPDGMGRPATRYPNSYMALS